MEDIVIRIAGEEDFPALEVLYYEFHEFHVRGVPDHLRSLGLKGTWDRERFHEALRKIFADEEACLYLAEFDGQTAGLIEVYLRKNEENLLVVQHKYIEIQSLMVLEEYRNQGLGKKLFDAGVDWGRAKGAERVRLSVWEFNKSTISFYENLGFTTVKREMELPLE